MPARPPTIEQLKKIANDYNLGLSEAELETYHGLVETVVTTDYQHIDQLPEIEAPPVKYPRSSGYQPTPEENPLSAWYWKCSIKGAGSGVHARFRRHRRHPYPGGGGRYRRQGGVRGPLFFGRQPHEPHGAGP